MRAAAVDVVNFTIPSSSMSTVVRISADVAKTVLPVLLNHAADELERDTQHRYGNMPERLRAGTAGGNQVESMEQNLPHALPASLDNFWRVLCTFEELALGHCIGSTRPVHYTHPDDRFPRVWMLHAAARAIQTAAVDHGCGHAVSLLPLAEDWLALEQPPYRRI